MTYETVSVIGLGYIGLPTAAVIAGRKKKVIGVDVNPQAVDLINRGKIHIMEPDLDVVVHGVVSEGWLRATTTAEPADAFLIAVPTPFKDDKEPDLSYIEAAAKAIAPVLRAGNLVILESTSPVGATERLARWLAETRADLTFPQTHGEASDIRIAHCPERVLPGHVLRELVDNDRVVGGLTPKCSEAAVAFYKMFVEGDCIVTDARTAEMCKLAENSFRDVNIAFANEMSVICDRLGIDVWDLIGLANRHPRVKILQPGPGVGGHCIAVDPWFIVASAPEEARLVRAAREINDAKPDWVIDKVKAVIGEFLMSNPDKTAGDVTLACLGLSFKPNIDDLRQSPALDIATRLAGSHAGRLMLVEPHIESLPAALSGHEKVEIEEAIAQADVLVLLVAHDAFRDIDTRLKPGQILFAATRN
jgi:UDP-N-acetyl-D-mannosaminuronic acid dehydrogenase